jgi:hypothetical protein
VTSGAIRCSKGTPIIKKPNPSLFIKGGTKKEKTKVLTLNIYMAMGPSRARCQEWPWRTASRQDIRGSELIITRKIPITTSRVVNTQCNRSSGVINDLTLYSWWSEVIRYSKHGTIPINSYQTRLFWCIFNSKIEIQLNVNICKQREQRNLFPFG